MVVRDCWVVVSVAFTGFACLLSYRASVGHANGLPVDVLLIENYGNGHKTPNN